MRVNLAVFICAVFFSSFYSYQNINLISPVFIISILLIISFSILFAFVKKNKAVPFFVIFGLFLGFSSGYFYQKSQTPLPEKGFVTAVFQISDFPELRQDGQYEVHAGNINIISTNAYALYKGQTAQITGFVSTYRIQNQQWKTLYAKEIIPVKAGPIVFMLITQSRKSLNDRIIETSNDEVKSLLFSLIMANTHFINYSTSQSFKMTGVTHLLAIFRAECRHYQPGNYVFIKKDIEKFPYLYHLINNHYYLYCHSGLRRFSCSRRYHVPAL